MSRLEAAARTLVVVGVTVVVAVAAYALFVRFPTGEPSVAAVRLVGVLLVLGAVGAAIRLGAGIAGSLFPGYDVAEVAVEGEITRSGSGGGFPPSGFRPGADSVVEQIDRADADGNVDALLMKLNTPGGAVVPSDDIRLAAERFDGPTVAYTTDTCASGGYWIASGCDELWARKGSIVGSIGVIGSTINLSDLADRVDVSYERLAAGDFKDAGTPLKEFTDDDRAYLQGIVDDYYETFVDRVVEGTDLDEETVRGTEARVYVGAEAAEMGLVDHLGTRRDVEDTLADRLGRDSVSVREFRPQRGLSDRLRGGAATVAYAFGAGLTSVLPEDFEFRL